MTRRKPKAPEVDEQALRLQQLLDRYRANASASRDAVAWARYYGVCDSVLCVGYTIRVRNERYHVLSRIRREG